MNIHVFNLVFAEALDHSFLKFPVKGIIRGKKSQVFGQKNSIQAFFEHLLAQYRHFTMSL